MMTAVTNERLVAAVIGERLLVTTRGHDGGGAARTVSDAAGLVRSDTVGPDAYLRL